MAQEYGGDPAIAAAQRAWDARYVGRLVSTVESAAHDGLGALAIAAAREMAAPLRKLHKPITEPKSSHFHVDDRSELFTYCASCGVFTAWDQCPTARLVYSSSELEGDSDAQIL
ncbi:hypothetical protein SEA_HORUS_75 [Gordonia phage Horus]|uniref:Uncharacterized protein n=2 Tax=Langleyhallvirinae TaxID=2732613 RepID=A0A385E1J0_9CAUD|nr:hypothetical protein HOT93_gp075 [Gordonia phage Horus]YP_009808413.1 hypothetical protein HOT94_gp072 [Gordonia phage Phistory]AXQ63927.1 hypothetical protein SEA_HORUS_75 [Gordonia phage Horus]AXQ64777.1 hypothetical protein SEA_PHISTORY_72 [Gordonia phage Phistory]WNM69780.1 hypothetical protein SEA_CRATER_73 [Gordonia phage Crater]